MYRPTFGVGARFALVVPVVVPSLMILAEKGTDGLTSTRQLTDTLFNDIIATEHATADMVAAMDDVHAAALSTLDPRYQSGAVLPDHAGDAAGLVCAADRALYLAKNLGRDRVETARSNGSVALTTDSTA